jgi:hypothetical protein
MTLFFEENPANRISAFFPDRDDRRIATAAVSFSIS